MKSSASVTPDLFAGLVPLNALRTEGQEELARKSKIVNCKSGAYLFRVGDPATAALFLLEGELQLEDAAGATVASLRAGGAGGEHRIAHQSPRTIAARCKSAVKCLAVDAHLLDVMLTWDQTDSLEVGELSSGQAEAGDDWMMKLLQMRAFQMVPPAHLQAMFLRMERIAVEPGQVIVRQGEAGDYFYVIIEGRCIVTREQPNQKAIRLAELEAGACFGEEALIADDLRNATVTMLSSGNLGRLLKTDFQQLLTQPLMRRLGAADARALVAANRAKFLDVRLPSEFQNHHLEGSLNIPLYMLRYKLNLLDTQTTYICVCDTGRRGSVASFVLNQKGYDAYTLERGLASMG